MTRKIVHIDMDCFYAAVEMRDNPALRDVPIAIGGSSTGRGVISTCNYPARKFGIHSAMPTATALKKCPELIVVPGRMEVYKEASQSIRSVFDKYTDLVEPLSLDEAYLDLTDATERHGSATLIAQDIRNEIFKTTGLTASAGIAPLKFVAKVASDLNKPNGQCTIEPKDIYTFLESLPLKKIPGVGKVTNEKLKSMGFETCGDIRASNKAFLAEKFGKYGRVLWNRSHGIDEREVQVSRIRKSVGVERTFAQDMRSLDEMVQVVNRKLLPELERRADKHLKSRRMHKLGVKVKFQDFQQTTKEQVSTKIDGKLLESLLVEAVSRGNGKAVRLLGVHIGLSDDVAGDIQLDLDF